MLSLPFGNKKPRASYQTSQEEFYPLESSFSLELCFFSKFRNYDVYFETILISVFGRSILISYYWNKWDDLPLYVRYGENTKVKQRQIA